MTVAERIWNCVQDRAKTIARPRWLASGHRRRRLREYLTGYIMILPSTLLIFTFGIFPVGFALYVSLHKWRIKKGDFIGLSNYVRVIGDLAYLLGFVLGVGALLACFFMLRKIAKQAKENHDRPWWLGLTGILHAATVLACIRWLVFLLPEILGVAVKIVGLERTSQLFRRMLVEALRAETVLPAWHLFAGLLIGSLILGWLATRLWRNRRNLAYQIDFVLVALALVGGVLLIWFSYNEVALAYRIAAEAGADPGIWPQIVTISSGVMLLAIAWKMWKGAAEQTSGALFGLRLFGAIGLMVGAWLLIAALPTCIASGSEDMWNGLKVTAFYSIGTVPFQIGFSLFLAILLFQKLPGSAVFRMLFFLPYVTPTVASAAVFRQIFASRYQAPMNAIFRLIGLEPKQWLLEPDGVFALLADSIGIVLPTWAAGPSLALAVIMIYSIWTFVGYDTVIYLAGLGNIPLELKEAAEIDGANKWGIFLHVIWPLLSPTTYFLSLIAVIGTFKAFNHIWVMRQGAALGTTDTFSIVIFSEFFEKLRYGYASALAFVLFAVILSLTYLNNKIQGSRVFYG